MASIEKRGNNSYRISVSCGYDNEGKKIFKRKNIVLPEGLNDKQRKKELDNQKILFEKEVENGTFLEGGKITFSEFIKKWFDDYAEVELRPKTVSRYKELLRRIEPTLGHIRLDKLQPVHLMEFYNDIAGTGVRFDYRYTIKPEQSHLLMDSTAISLKTNLNYRTIKQISNGNPTTKKSVDAISSTLGIPIKKLFDVIDSKKCLSSKTINEHHKLISAILTSAVQWQIIDSNPAERVKAPKVVRKEAKYYSLEEVDLMLKLLAKEPLKYQAMINIVICCGLRLEEFSGLEWTDIDFNNMTLTVSKQLQYLPEKGIFEIDGAKTESGNRTITIPELLVDLLVTYKRWQTTERLKMGDIWVDTNKLFTKVNGDLIFPDTPSRWFRKFVKKNNLPYLNFHQIRHTSASILIGEGVDIATVSKRLGHSDINVTLRIYTHAIKEYDRDASDKLDNLFGNKKKNKFKNDGC